jgi:hypothetical protein
VFHQLLLFGWTKRTEPTSRISYSPVNRHLETIHPRPSLHRTREDFMRVRTTVVLLILIASACRTWHPGPGGPPRMTAVDSGGRPVSSIQTGSSLEIAAEGLCRGRFEFRPRSMTTSSDSPARRATRAAPSGFVLWYHLASSAATRPLTTRGRFRTFEEAEQACAAVCASLPIQRRKTDRARSRSPIATRRSPMVYPSNAGDACSTASRCRKAICG